MKNVNIEGLDKNAAITALINGGHDFKSASEYWAANRPARGTGFASRFYLALETAEMSEEAFEEFLKDESKNVVNHRSHYNAIRELANAIRAAK